MTILAISRDERFSPNSVEKDRAILEAASQNLCARIREEGLECHLKWTNEKNLTEHDCADICLSMARLPETLYLLKKIEAKGTRVVNSGSAVEKCSRSNLEAIMRQHHIPMPPDQGDHGVWIKRGDTAAQEQGDVVFCADKQELEEAKKRYLERGICNYVVSAHVKGDLVKFYAVGNTFFRYYYPTDDGDTKFGDEQHNGKAQHYAFETDRLQSEAARLAHLIGLDVYGGDAIVDHTGHFCIIDFNDWPSFSRCREEAAEAIGAFLYSPEKG